MTKISTTLLMLLFSATAYAQTENWNTIADQYHLSAYLVAALLIGVFVLFFSNRLYYYREQEVSNRSKQINTQLALVLNSNKTVVWMFSTAKIQKLFRICKFLQLFLREWSNFFAFLAYYTNRAPEDARQVIEILG